MWRHDIFVTGTGGCGISVVSYRFVVKGFGLRCSYTGEGASAWCFLNGVWATTRVFDRPGDVFGTPEAVHRRV
jgi:hypothetical protein